jgi:hypothetical protein
MDSTIPRKTPATKVPKMLPRPARTTTMRAFSVQLKPMDGLIASPIETSVPETPASALPRPKA